MEEVKRWVRHRSQAFDDEAARYGLPAPKGLLLIGVQGCGKSLTAKAVAGTFHLPLVRLDLAAVFGSGSPESAMRRAILVAESLAPVVLWVDEIEKGFAETGAGGGSSTRVFGSFITWLQEKQAPAFVVATANEVEQLPPELLRKGRFDEIFFVDLPDVHERKSILSIHLNKRKRDPHAFDLDTLARQSEHFSGAELEQGVLAGMFRAFAGKREVQTRDIQQELDLIVPLYVTYEEKIKSLREWAKTRARRASLDQSLVDLFDKE
jgi:SpoVK/Ycf46/Vps4 family AAA+-type ATPase